MDITYEPDGQDPVTVDYAVLGKEGSAEEIMDNMGEENALQHLADHVQRLCKMHLISVVKAGKLSPEAIVQAGQDYRPGIRKTALNKAEEAVADLTPEQKAYLLKQLQAGQRKAA